MSTEYLPFKRSQTQALVELLTSEEWPYHATGTPSAAIVMDRVTTGYYDGEFVRTFWIVHEGESVGLLRLSDVGSGTPQFDLRIRQAWRSRGLGTSSVIWLTAQLFNDEPDLRRIEAATRQDNEGMRKVLRRCGYVKEAHYRQDWPAPDGSLHDTVVYAILRSDWVSGTTTEPDWDDEPLPQPPP